MNQHRFDTLVQLVVGVVAVVILAVFVVRGELEAAQIVPIIGAILSAFGFAEVGRRQRLKKNRDDRGKN